MIKFVFGEIAITDTIILEMRKNHKAAPSVKNWEFTTCMLLKKLFTEYQYRLPLRHMTKNI